MRNIRRVTAERLSAAWATIPHVTQCDKSDITELEKLRQKYAKQAEKAGGKLTITAIALKVIAGGAQEVPAVQQLRRHGRPGDRAQEVRAHRRRGGHRSRPDRPGHPRRRQQEASCSCRSSSRSLPRRPRPASSPRPRCSGGSFTISNLGGIGGTYFTPIVNSPEVAILGMSRAVHRAGVERHGVRAAADDAAVALLRPPRDRRRRRRALPALGLRGVRESVRAVLRGAGVRPAVPWPPTQLVVIGAGPGGYAAAFYAADLGMDVTLVDREANPGGVCVYRGCIPSKALLHVAKLVEEARHAAAWGVEFGEPKVDLDKLRAFKDAVVGRLTGGTGQLVKARKVKYLRGTATLTGPTSLDVAKVDGGSEQVTFQHAIIAIGSQPAKVPGLSIDSPRVMDSTSALELESVPVLAARRRRRLHRPRTGQRLRRARQQGHRRRDDARAVARAPTATWWTCWRRRSRRPSTRCC